MNQLQEAIVKTMETENLAQQANKRASSSEAKLSDITKVIKSNMRNLYRSAENDAKAYAGKRANIIRWIIIIAIAGLTAFTTGAVAQKLFP